MLDILKFIFSSFWVWLGTVILASCFFNSISSAIFRAVNCKSDKK